MARVRRSPRPAASRGARAASSGLVDAVDALARLARRGGKGHSPLRGDRPALDEDEVLIAVAVHRAVAVRRVRIPAAKAAARGGDGAAALDRAVLLEIARRAAEIDLVASELVEQVRPAGVPPAMSEGDQRLLVAAGIDASAPDAEETTPLHRATAEYARLLHDSYTVEEAAALLGVNASRIRQRLTGPPRSLYGIKMGGAWRIPKVQFEEGGGLVPGIDRVVRALADDLHPVALYRWLTTPSSELTGEDDASIAPLDWLRMGNDAEAVARLGSRL